MNIAAHKQEIIKKINLLNDVDTIIAIKDILDFGLPNQEENDKPLNASIDRAINDSKKGMDRSHEEVMADLRKRYNL